MSRRHTLIWSQRVTFRTRCDEHLWRSAKSYKNTKSQTKKEEDDAEINVKHIRRKKLYMEIAKEKRKRLKSNEKGDRKFKNSKMDEEEF